MSKVVATQVVLVSVNEVSDEEAEQMCENHGVDTLEEVADEMSGTVESHLAHRVFADADKIPILDVDADVDESYNMDDYAELRAIE